MFDFLWTILLGITGGIISSVIVSRVFMIQGEYQQQVKFVESIIKKLGMISGYLSACRVVFEVSHEQDVLIENEMKENGYKDEMKYYAAHREKNCILTNGILETFKSHLLKTVEKTNEEILNSIITDRKWYGLLGNIRDYLHDIESIKELNFSVINELSKKEQKVLDDYESCKRVSNKQWIKLVLKDKLMIALYVLIVLLIVATSLDFVFKW